MRDAKQPGVCVRLAEIRARHYGPRGKSRFARDLGIGSSTYDRYERDRKPPAELLAKAAALTGVRLEWLITGEGERDVALKLSDRSAALVKRLQELLNQREDLAGRVDEFLTQLEQESDA